MNIGATGLVVAFPRSLNAFLQRLNDGYIAAETVIVAAGIAKAVAATIMDDLRDSHLHTGTLSIRVIVY